METNKKPASQNPIGINISTGWLSYITGGLLVIANAYQLPLAISILTGSCGLGTSTVSYGGCSTNFTVFPYAFTAVVPAVLVLLGLLLIIFKRKSIAQLAAIAIFVLLAALYYPLFNADSYTSGTLAQQSLWYYLLQPAYLFPVIELLLAGAGSLYLKEPSIFAPMTNPIRPKEVLVRTQRLGSTGMYAVLLVVVLILGTSGYFVWHNISQSNHDTNELKALNKMSTTVYQDLASENPVNLHSVAVWKSKETIKAEGQGLTLRDFNDNNFTICGWFDTNKSGKTSLQATNQQTDGLFNSFNVTMHPAGSVCVQYLITNAQVQRPIGGPSQNQLLTDIQYQQTPGEWVVSTYSLNQATTSQVGDIPVNSLQIIKPDGTRGQLQDLVVGSIVSEYYDINALSGSMTVYKVAITNNGSDGANCSVFATETFQHSPSPNCPATVNNVTVAHISMRPGSNEIDFNTAAGTTESTSWQSEPAVYNSSGNLIQYSQLLGGTKVNLTYNGPVLTAIHEVVQ